MPVKPKYQGGYERQDYGCKLYGSDVGGGQCVHERYVLVGVFACEYAFWYQPHAHAGQRSYQQDGQYRQRVSERAYHHASAFGQIYYVFGEEIRNSLSNAEIFYKYSDNDVFSTGALTIFKSPNPFSKMANCEFGSDKTTIIEAMVKAETDTLAAYWTSYTQALED